MVQAYSADVVIVGGGPSAIGLLYGLLLQHIDHDDPPPDDDDDNDTKTRIPKFTIALIERGDERTTTKDSPLSSSSSSSPKDWFSTSHPFMKKSHQTDSIVYQSTAQKGLHNRILSIPTGKRLGGGMNINATLVTKPIEDDFARWPIFWKEKVNHVTSYSETKRMSRIMSGVYSMEKVMRDNGALSTQNSIDLMSSQQSPLFEMNNGFVKVQCDDIDTTKMKLKSFNCAATKKYVNENSTNSGVAYERVNVFDAIIRPLLERHPHLKSMVTFHYNTQVERILIKNETKSDNSNDEFNVQGVECSYSDETSTEESRYFKITARQKVVLCAGAILSPALLLISGIGDIDELEKEGILPLQSNEKFTNHWYGVGKNLRDHFIVTRAFRVPLNFWKSFDSINGVRGWTALDIMSTKGNDGVTNNARVLFKLIDPSTLTIMPYIVSSFFHRHIDEPRFIASRSLSWIIYIINATSTLLAKSIRIMFMFIFALYPVKWIFKHSTAYILFCLLNPESKGTISVRRKRKKRYNHEAEKRSKHHKSRLSDFEIHVNPEYLTNPNDIEKIEQSWKVLDKVSQDRWFPYTNNCFEILPGYLYKKIFGPNFLRQYCADFGLPYFHWTSTNSMKLEESEFSREYVVDSKLQVRNVSNLHVCDASVIPDNISGPTALTCMGLGYVTSSFLFKTSSKHNR